MILQKALIAIQKTHFEHKRKLKLTNFEVF